MGEEPAHRLKSIASRLPERLSQHNLTLIAAGVAYYAFLAFVPAIVAFISIYGLVADAADVERQVGDVAGALPAEVQDFLVFQLKSIINASSAGVSIALIISIVLALWSASGGMAALITGLHVAHGQDEPKRFVAKRGKAMSLTFGAMILLGVVVFLVAALPPLLSNAGLGAAGRVALNILRWPILAVVMVVGIGSLYRLAVPGRPAGWLGFLTPGTVVATLGWLVVSALFAVYTESFASLSKTYGALASIVVVLIWLWLSSLLVLIGAEVDAVDEGERAEPDPTRATRDQ